MSDLTNPQTYANIATTILAVIGGAASVAAVLPPTGPAWYVAIRSVIVVLGANVGHAANAAPGQVKK